MFGRITSLIGKIIRALALIALGVGVIVGIFVGVQRGFLNQSKHPIFSRPDPASILPQVVQDAEVSEQEYLFNATSADRVELGMLINSLSKQIAPWWFDVFITTEEGALTERYVVYDEQNNHILELEPECGDSGVCRIDRIAIYSQQFVTQKGVGIGSTYAKLRSAYNIKSIRYINAGFYIEMSDGVVYVIPGEYGGEFAEGDEVPLDHLPGEALIQRIILQ